MGCGAREYILLTAYETLYFNLYAQQSHGGGGALPYSEDADAPNLSSEQSLQQQFNDEPVMEVCCFDFKNVITTLKVCKPDLPCLQYL